MSPEEKTRLDILLVELGMVQTRQRAQALIMSGKVRVNDLIADKPGTRVGASANITVTGEEAPYVSRGGQKLEAALKDQNISVEALVCMDVGASTGGFTDCLLQHGAKQVYAVDVGYGQLAWSLRQDPRVTVFERTNIRNLARETIPCVMDLITIDVSFISLKIVVPAVLKFTHVDTILLALIKPQFEVGKGKVGKGGVVRDPQLQQEVVEDLISFFVENGLTVNAVIPSPILGPKGNQEFIAVLRLQE